MRRGAMHKGGQGREQGVTRISQPLQNHSKNNRVGVIHGGDYNSIRGEAMVCFNVLPTAVGSSL